LQCEVSGNKTGKPNNGVQGLPTLPFFEVAFACEVTLNSTHLRWPGNALTPSVGRLVFSCTKEIILAG